MARVTWLDRAIGAVAPRAARRRVLDRHAFDLLQRKYEGASLGRRTDGWRAAGTSADTEFMGGGRLLRDRMRDLVRNNPHAAKAVSVLANNIVGDGIIPRANTGDEKLDKKVNDLWTRWAKVCDADGQLDFYGMQTLVVREMVEAGEVLARKRLRRPSDGLPVPLQIQIQEADLLDQNKVGAIAANGNVAIQGVEFNQIGKRVQYWMFPYHPGNIFYDPKVSMQSRAVPASDVAHLYEKLRVQVRGVPWGAPVIRSLWDLANYEDAELERKRLEACMVGVVTGGDEADMAIGLPPENPEPNGVVDSEGAIIERFEPGMFAYARGGRDIKFNQPAQSGSYEAYKRASLRTVAAGFRIPYELLSGDLSDVNYSSIRAGLVEFRRLISAVQWQIVIPMYCQVIWDWFIETAYLSGELDVAQVAVQWCPPKFVAVDPLKDATADLLAIRSGTRTLAEVIGEHGRNPDDVFAEIAATNGKLDALGLILDSDPRKVAKTGAMQAADEPGVQAKDQ